MSAAEEGAGTGGHRKEIRRKRPAKLDTSRWGRIAYKVGVVGSGQEQGSGFFSFATTEAFIELRRAVPVFHDRGCVAAAGGGPGGSRDRADDQTDHRPGVESLRTGFECAAVP